MGKKVSHSKPKLTADQKMASSYRYWRGARVGAIALLRGVARPPYYKTGVDMGKRSREKGANFERKVASEIVLACAPLGAKYRDCYRTPMSGGHPGGDAGDLRVSDLIRPVFPWCVECKHYGNWHPGVMFEPRDQEKNWAIQALTAAKKLGSKPLLVMSGNHTGAYVAALYEDLVDVYPEFATWAPSLLFEIPEVGTWLMVKLADFTYQLGKECKRVSPLYKGAKK